MSRQTLAVVGAGNMGSGLAQKIATEGFEVVLVDVDAGRVDLGLASIDRSLAEAARRNVLTPEQSAAARARVRGTTRIADASDASLVIEAVFEDRALKQDVFRRLDDVCRPDAILATNTSSFLVAEMASATKRPGRVLGLHYFYHPAKNHLVEVVAGAATDPDVQRRAWALQEQLRKIPIAAGDAYGFIVNRFFVVWLMEAVRLLEEGVANAATIDALSKQAFGIGMGPFELMNVTGIPIAFHASTTIGQAFGPLYGPPARLGQQTAHGTPWPLDGPVDLQQPGDQVRERLLGVTFLVAAALVDEGVGTREDTDVGARVGLRWPVGPFEMMNQYGTTRSSALASAAASRWGMPVPPSLERAGRTNSAFSMALVRSQARGGIATLTIDRPDAMNALNEAVVAQLGDAFRRAADDPAVEGIVIAGAGRSFVAGADIRFFISHMEHASVDRIVRFTQDTQRLLLEIDTCPKPVVARIHGLALGGGVELALACDYIVAAEGARVGFPETGIGIFPGLGGTQRTTRRIGRGLTKWLVETGQIIPVEEAQAIGLVDRVAAHDELDAAAAALLASGPAPMRRVPDAPPSHASLAAFFETNDVERLRLGTADADHDNRLRKAMSAVGTKAPIALRIAARLIDEGADVPLPDALQLELARVHEIFSTRDALIGLSSIGKTRPVFEGR